MKSRSLQRILAARGGALGDFLVTLPAIQALKRMHPGAEIELLTRPAWGRLAVDSGIVQIFRSSESAAASALGSEAIALDPEWREWLGSFDLIVSWLPDRAGIFRRRALEAGAGKFWQGIWSLTGGSPAAEQLAVLENGAVTLDLESPLIRLTFPEKSPPFPVAGRIALHPGSGGAAKNWPFPLWHEVLRSLRAEGILQEMVFIAGEAEAETAERQIQQLRADGFHVLPLLHRSLTEVAKALTGCAFYLGHDTGISHLAAACNVPCRLLFGPTDPAVWAPPGPRVKVLTAPDGQLSALTAGEVFRWLTMETAAVPCSAARISQTPCKFP